MRILQRPICLLLSLLFVLPPLGAQDETGGDEPDLEWPREIVYDGVRILVYQPQPETFAGNKLTARAAVSVTPKGASEPIFGAIWIEARVETDREERIVDLLDLKIPRTRFPEVKEANVRKLKELIEKRMIEWTPEVSLDHLLTTLENADVEAREAKAIKNDPPAVVLVTEPTELVLLSGRPELRPIKDSNCMRVINTQHFLVLEPASKAYFLNLGMIWMTAPDLMKGPWTEAKNPPANVTKIAPPYEPEPDEEKIVPAVLVVDKPTELVTCDGEPKFTPLEGNELLYVANTDASVLLELASQTYYLQASGRWFSAKSWKGPWTFVPQGKLPASFRKIPASSEVGDLRVFVAGTEEAKDAVNEAQIPQTATIKRDDKSLQVTYDGEPVFEEIGGDTENVAYALNTEYAVLRDNKAADPVFYCCWNAVWYVAPSPTGPWRVATKVPSDFYLIPESCPVHHVTYVRIYKVEPTVVYVGYTAGYTGGYVSGGTVVYGTGYTYVVWVGTVYYPRPVTYGWGYRYYPLSGGWFSPYSIGGVVRRTRRRTRRRVRRRTYRRSQHHRNNVYRRNSARNTAHRNRNQAQRNRNQAQRNRNQAQRNRNQGQRNVNRTQRQNNHYADRNGNVSRRDNNGNWQKRQNSGWSDQKKNNASRERDYNSRQRGSSRSQQHRSSRGGKQRAAPRGGRR